MLRRLAALVIVLAFLISAAAEDHTRPPKLRDQTRLELTRVFVAREAFVHKTFPVGKRGLTIVNGEVFPSEAELRDSVARSGVACRPGDHVQITDLRFTSRAIVFEINGGLEHDRWWQKIQINSGETVEGGTTESGTGDRQRKSQASYLKLAFTSYVPELTVEQVKQMLAPVLDFNRYSPEETYAMSLPPKIREAVQHHTALVGMDRQMVLAAKGRPPRRIRELDGNTEYEEWIYGQPPREVEFIRFVGEKVVRIEAMAADGEKVVRTQPEIERAEMPAPAPTQGDYGNDTDTGRKRPGLLNPGESLPEQTGQPSIPAARPDAR